VSWRYSLDKDVRGGADDGAWSVQQTKDGGYIIVGVTDSFGDAVLNEELWLIKTDAKGDTLWTKNVWG